MMLCVDGKRSKGLLQMARLRLADNFTQVVDIVMGEDCVDGKEMPASHVGTFFSPAAPCGTLRLVSKELRLHAPSWASCVRMLKQTRASPSGKAMASQAIIRGFESRCPLHGCQTGPSGPVFVYGLPPGWARPCGRLPPAVQNHKRRGANVSKGMTREECTLAIEGLSDQIDKYAELLVRKGLCVREGQEVVVQAPVECADFARRVVRLAYREGAGHVTVIWSDDTMARLEYENVPLEHFRHTPTWKVEQLNSLAEAGACFLFIEGSDPSALDGIDPAKPAAAAHARNTECLSFRNGMDFGKNVWCIAGAPVEAWAQKVFPDCAPYEAVYRLWLAILKVARADGLDPQLDWETHNATFEKNKSFLNDMAFDHLHYTSKNGTDLTIGLNAKGIWEGGAGRTVDGTVFFPNIPTEEVFTTPARTRVDGTVYSAMPLVHAGQIVDDFWLRFEAGKVVEYDAARGREVLRHIIETDENSAYLGECALISKRTPIRQSGLLFFDTLYDENASCHLALGTGFPECLEGGLDMDKDALLANGVNQSATHVDFMIGSDDLNITGVKSSGEEVSVFCNGAWAWESE